MERRKEGRYGGGRKIMMRKEGWKEGREEEEWKGGRRNVGRKEGMEEVGKNEEEGRKEEE